MNTYRAVPSLHTSLHVRYTSIQSFYKENEDLLIVALPQHEPACKFPPPLEAQGDPPTWLLGSSGVQDFRKQSGKSPHPQWHSTAHQDTCYRNWSSWKLRSLGVSEIHSHSHSQ